MWIEKETQSVEPPYAGNPGVAIRRLFFKCRPRVHPQRDWEACRLFRPRSSEFPLLHHPNDLLNRKALFPCGKTFLFQV